MILFIWDMTLSKEVINRKGKVGRIQQAEVGNEVDWHRNELNFSQMMTSETLSNNSVLGDCDNISHHNRQMNSERGRLGSVISIVVRD